MSPKPATILVFHGCGQDPTIFKSLLKSLHKNIKHEWIFLKGPHNKKEGGYGWYKYKNDDSEIDWNARQQFIDEISEQYSDRERTLLVGFSEGAQMALDLSRSMPNCIGVVALSPSYEAGLHNFGNVDLPVVMVTSSQDSTIAIKYSQKWKKYINGDIIEISHNKGHKVYLPEETRQIIIDTFFPTK